MPDALARRRLPRFSLLTLIVFVNGLALCFGLSQLYTREVLVDLQGLSPFRSRGLIFAEAKGWPYATSVDMTIREGSSHSIEAMAEAMARSGVVPDYREYPILHTDISGLSLRSSWKWNIIIWVLIALGMGILVEWFVRRRDATI